MIGPSIIGTFIGSYHVNSLGGFDTIYRIDLEPLTQRKGE